ncbi:MAG: TonB family protein [Bacteroidales bacterium]|nr:TonB family protein [Bacteroidales bacterium]
MIQYFITTSVYLALFYLIYVLLISKDTFYRRNRLFLLSGIIISLLLPLVRISTGAGSIFSSFSNSLGAIFNIPQVNVYAADQPAIADPGPSTLLLVYLAGSLIAFLILVFNLFKLILYISKYRVKGSRVVLTPAGKESGFSAMGYVFLDGDLEDGIKKTILDHEQLHIGNKHFYDIILVRLIGIFFWFNPFIYLYERSLKALHEFEADQEMLESGRNFIGYQRLILNQVFNTGIFTLQNGFSGPSLIKKRMIMMTKRRSKKISGLKLLLAVPFLLFAFMYFSCSSDEINPEVLSDRTNQEAVSDNKPKSNVKYSDPKHVNDEIFVVVEDMPTFRGGDVNFFREWVQKNVRYPAEAASEGIQGKVFVMFVVDKDGYVTDAEIMRGVDPSLDNEVIRVVLSSPVWSAGRQRGVAVPVRFSITVNFQLQ